MIYKLGHIYAIWDCEDHNLIYYGSTCDLNRRINKHKQQGNTCTSKQIIERGNYEYVILETHENIDEYDLIERERWYILNKVCVNKHIPHRTKAEWYEDNKEKIAKQKKKCYQDHKDERKDYMREYYQNHKDERNEYNSEYYQEHRDKSSQKVKCRYCDKEMSKSSLTRHIKKYCKGQNHSSTLT